MTSFLPLSRAIGRTWFQPRDSLELDSEFLGVLRADNPGLMGKVQDHGSVQVGGAQPVPAELLVAVKARESEQTAIAEKANRPAAGVAINNDGLKVCQGNSA